MTLTDKQRDDLNKARNFAQSVAVQAVEIQNDIDAVLAGEKELRELQTDEVLRSMRRHDDEFPSLVDFSEDLDAE